jgi:hypothetical protein
VRSLLDGSTELPVVCRQWFVPVRSGLVGTTVHQLDRLDVGERRARQFGSRELYGNGCRTPRPDGSHAHGDRCKRGPAADLMRFHRRRRGARWWSGVLHRSGARTRPRRGAVAGRPEEGTSARCHPSPAVRVAAVWRAGGGAGAGDDGEGRTRPDSPLGSTRLPGSLDWCTLRAHVVPQRRRPRTCPTVSLMLARLRRSCAAASTQAG